MACGLTNPSSFSLGQTFDFCFSYFRHVESGRLHPKSCYYDENKS